MARPPSSIAAQIRFHFHLWRPDRAHPCPECVEGRTVDGELCRHCFGTGYCDQHEPPGEEPWKP